MWSLAGSQVVDQPICCSVPALRPASRSSCFGPESCGFGSAALGLWVGQLASAPGAHPPKVSGVGASPGFQVWAASRGFRCRPPVR